MIYNKLNNNSNGKNKKMLTRFGRLARARWGRLKEEYEYDSRGRFLSVSTSSAALTRYVLGDNHKVGIWLLI